MAMWLFREPKTLGQKMISLNSSYNVDACIIIL